MEFRLSPFKRAQTLPPNSLRNFGENNQHVFEKWGVEFLGCVPFSTSTPSCTPWPKLFMVVFRGP